MADPHWWTAEMDDAWARVKAALRRDWEQTRHDLGGAAPELNQSAGDTVRQMLGRAPIPPADTPNPGWREVEPAVRYGFGAAGYYETGQTWGMVEERLREDWTGQRSHRWDEVAPHVRYGWDAARDR